MITRKIQIAPVGTKVEVSKAYESWREASYLCRRIANRTMSHLYVQELIPEMSYLVDDVQRNLKSIKKDENGCFVNSRQNTCYQLTKEEAEKLPSYIRSSLADQIWKKYVADKAEIMKGNKAIANFKNGMPVPISKDAIRQLKEEEEGEVTFVISEVKYRMCFGRDRSNNAALIRGLMSGEVHLCDSEVRYDKAKKKLFLMACLKTAERPQAKGDRKGYVTLGVECPVLLMIQNPSLRIEIGSKEEYMARVIAIKAARERSYAKSRWNKGGHGRTKKMSAAWSARNKSGELMKNRNHVYSAEVIKECLRNRVAVIDIEDLAGIAELKPDHVLMRFWPYFQLQEMLEYKARANGIRVQKRKIDVQRKKELLEEELDLMDWYTKQSSLAVQA